jgi:RNA polymerase sigma-70 factor (ECF subfamily)
MAHAELLPEDHDVIFESNERRLLQRAKAGDRAAAEELVEQTYTVVYASLCRLTGGDVDLAADLTQDTYRKAWEALARFDGRSKLTTWLYRIAYTTFLNHVRTPRRLVDIEDSAAALADPSPGVDDSLSRRQEEEQLRSAVLALPEDLRFTVTAHFWAGVPIPEIARNLGISAVAIRKRLKKAFSILEATLEKEDDAEAQG